jgi:hypothetical protein
VKCEFVLNGLGLDYLQMVIRRDASSRTARSSSASPKCIRAASGTMHGSRRWRLVHDRSLSRGLRNGARVCFLGAIDELNQD